MKNDSEKIGGKYTMKYDVTTDTPFDLSTAITNSLEAKICNDKADENLTNCIYSTTEYNVSIINHTDS